MASGNTITTTGVLYINGVQVENTFTNLSKLTKKLESELKKLPRGTEEFVAKSRELEDARRQFENVRNEIRAIGDEAEETDKTLTGFFGNTKQKAGEMFTQFLSGQLSFRALGSTIKTFAAESWVAIGSIPVIGWLIALAAGVALVAREVLQYNEAMYAANQITADITKLQGDALDKMTIRSQTLEEVLGLDRKELLETAKNLVQNYSVSYDEAMNVIERAAIKGGKSNTEFLKSLKEYPTFFAKAGYSLNEFANIINAGFDLGIYDDKLPDSIKEFNLSMQEQTKSTRDALVNAFGATFSDDLLKRVSTGKTTIKDSLIEINKESQKYNLTQKQQAQLTADIFRGAGEDVGGFARIMEVVTIATGEQNEVLTETQQIIKDQIDRYNELGEAKNDALKSDSIMAFKRDFENAWLDIKKIFYQFVEQLRGSVNGLKLAFMNTRDFIYLLPIAISSVFSAMKIDFQNMGRIADSFSKVLKDVFTLNFDNVGKSFEDFSIQLKNSFSTTQLAIKNVGKELGTLGNINQNNLDKIKKGDAAKAAAQKILDDRRKKAEEDAKKGNNYDGSEARNAAKKKASDKAAKDAEAARKKEEAARKKFDEERLKDLEDSLKAEADANNRSLELQVQLELNKAKLKDDSLTKDLLLADLERSKELNSQRKQQDEILKNIDEFEDKIRKAKSNDAKQYFEKGLEKERQILRTHDEIILIAEETHQLKLKTIREKWKAKDFEDLVKKDQLEIDRQKRVAKEELDSIKTLFDAKNKIREKLGDQYSENEISNISSLSEAKKILEEKANQDLLNSSISFLKIHKEKLEGFAKTFDPESPEGKALAEKISLFSDKMAELQGGLKNPREKGGGKNVEEWTDAESQAMQIDILGFTVQQWQESFDNLDTTSGKLKAVGMAFQALANAGQMFSELTRSLGEKDFKRFEQIQNKKKDSLLNQLNTGFLTQEQYNKQVQKLEAETANKKAEMEYKQAKADKAARMFAVIGNTAMGIASALAAPFPINTWLPWIVGAMGAVQLGIVAAQPLPERPSFDGGGFTGPGFGSPDDSGFKPAGVVHENEWVAPKWMLEEPRTARVIDYLESVRAGKTKPMADGGFASSEPQSPANNNTAIIQENTDPELKEFLRANLEFLEHLSTNGVFIENNEENGKLAKQMIKKWEDLTNKNKH